MPIKFRCPKCNQAYSIATKKAGTSLRCQKCDAKMRIPAMEPKADDDATVRVTDAPSSKPPADDQADVSAAMRNLLDDDDEVGEDEFVDLSADEAPENSPVVSVKAVEANDEPAAGDGLAKADNAPPEATAAGDEDDDLAAVLAFEQSLEEDESAPAQMAPLPDELFAEDDEEDEDDSWGGGRGNDDGEMDLTPMVDVTFLLLVFFMVTASFSIQKTLEVPPPNPDESGASQSQKIEDMEEKSVLVHIDSRNVISVDDEPLNDPTRLAEIMRSKRMSEVLITAHENSLHDMLTKVIDASNEIGMQKIRVGIVKGND
ncbi:MAG: biopolymer transport protein ExbD/transcription elongation factor Elf1 [Planctomycetaceae bacterium]|jgi:biopolymer transport protein ExbD/transcription elongation factor Elf1